MKKWKPHREMLLLLYFPIYLLLFLLTEHYITTNYWVSSCALDNAIPFAKEFVFAYVLWFPLMIGTTLWLLIWDRRAFVRYGWMAIISLTTCFVIYILFPSGQELRPTTVEGNGLASQLVRMIYMNDTNTNVFPSMHVVGTLVALAGILDTDSIGFCSKFILTVVSLFIILSTVFLKQHSILDVVSGIVLSLLVYPFVYKLHRRKSIKD